ncbi:YbhB/YbcL family Raf kinase inhibitor-like protein [Rhodococcus sp. D2-41]|uniref:YbhB/YbcL family Raf kinase inhibitor-like protein n=1 Tax=Speluncibacter jeojiensis TaxID=2710754 RepID=A0A9X4MAH7_9ACTN|nr:YbhB/YbcL family Raf kinase inhibitor-like protein [Rhodococcus sp. D2-41]MDG3009436.1 YbhB/YbcL family Raf kinase inhibitor-like protein [Rhodococcus sp. D2-41]MDG3016936.1 YbhB/YbcL family Raf kinase inhibitor-like protein [Corynebacteriales bacterium D3-21]
MFRQLSWSGAPAGTAGSAVSVFDRDAGNGRGYWHWAVVDIPASVTGLRSGAGAPDGTALPPGARQLRGSSGVAGNVGAAPPAGAGTHHHVITVSALDRPVLPVPASADAGDVESIIQQHTVARGAIVPVATR